jgi:hypothetical protein
MAVDKILWRFQDPETGETLPAWSYLYTADDEAFEDHSLCENQTDEDPCEGPMHCTGIEGDLWISLCEKHLKQHCAPVEQAEYDVLIEQMEA